MVAELVGDPKCLLALQIIVLCHKRLGHYYYQGLHRMIKLATVKSLPNLVVSNFPCETCLKGKQRRETQNLESKIPYEF